MAALSSEVLKVSVHDGIATALLNRPSRRNALNDALYDDLIRVFDHVNSNDGVTALILTGAGSHFCSGQDLADVDLQQRASTPSSQLPVGRFMRSVVAFSKLLVAAVNGPAVGIGATLLAHCDVVVAKANATIWTPFIKLGVVPEFGSSRLFPSRMNRGYAVRLLLLGEKLSAEECYRAGLITHLDVSAQPVADVARAIVTASAARDHRNGGSWKTYKAILAKAETLDTLQHVIDTELSHIDKLFSQGAVGGLTGVATSERVRLSKL
jgi:enoyl-CoA hydratase/carnithine racemase